MHYLADILNVVAIQNICLVYVPQQIIWNDGKMEVVKVNTV